MTEDEILHGPIGPVEDWLRARGVDVERLRRIGVRLQDELIAARAQGRRPNVDACWDEPDDNA